MWPVSVCHQVSTIGQRPPPITLWYQSQALGLIGSPTEPSSRSEERSWPFGMVGPPLHAGADRGRRGVEDRHAVALDDLPPDVLVGIVRRPLVHDAGRAVGERPVDDVGVAGDPADVGGAPVDVPLGLEVEDVAVGPGDAGQVAAGGVQDPLRLRGRARGVEDVERVLGAHRLGRAMRATAATIASSNQTSRPSRISHSAPVWRTTKIVSIDPTPAIASSTCALIGAVLPLRRAPSTVTSAFASENSIRSRTASARSRRRRRCGRRRSGRRRASRRRPRGSSAGRSRPRRPCRCRGRAGRWRSAGCRRAARRR